MIEIWIIVSALIIVFLTFLVLRVRRILFSLDPFGKKSVWLVHNEKINKAKDWRLRRIDEVERKGEKVLLVKAGEFGAGMLDTVKYALNKGFIVTVVSGNKTHRKSRDEVSNLFDKFPERFKYYVLDHRPLDHFAIIGKSDLFIEVPHEWDAKIKDSLGIENAYYDILDKFEIKFENAINMAKKADVDFVKTLPCYGT